MRRQQGFLLVASAVLLTLVAFLVTTLAYFSINNAATTSNHGQSSQAFYLAEAGLSRGLLAVAKVSPGELSRVACNTVNGTGVYAQNVGAGAFTVTGTTYNVASPVTLAADISDTDLIVPASGSLASYAPSGGVFVGGEIIRYGGKGTTSAQCGGLSTNCFLVSRRASGGTYATAHSAGRPIRQNLCYVAATGNVPATNPVATRTVSRVVMYAQDTNVWVVGNSDASGEVILNWSGEAWTRNTPSTVSDANLNAIYLNSSTNGWTVGNALAGTCPAAPASTGVFGSWNGTTWAQACSVATVINQNLLSVHCFSTTLCKAGAETDGTNLIIARYDPPAPTGWAEDAVTTGGGQANRVRPVNVNDVHMISATLAFAVGDNWTGTQPGEMILNWDGTTWRRSTAQASIANQNLYGIHCPTATRCWVVGANGTIATWTGAGTHFSGAGFTVNANVNGLTLRDVFCLSATNCWAVGDAAGGNATFVRLTGTTWSRDTTNIDASITNTANLRSVYCDTASNCWAVGDNYVFYWDGTVWLDWSGGVINAAVPLTVNAVALSLPLPSGPLITNPMRLFQWEEVTN